MTGTPLNEKQAEAVAHGDGPALILSGAGSGKTRVITSRAVRLISDGVAPWSVFCVTFTNKAAGEMRHRISSMLDIDATNLWISTFHSSCLRILKDEYRNAGYQSMPTVFDAVDQKSLVKGIIRGMGRTDAELPHRKCLSVISRYKNDMKGPEHLASEDSYPQAKETAEVFQQYQEALIKNNAVDFDDLMLVVIRLFKSREDVLGKYRERFRYIMVDEFQDTNMVQYSLIRLLVGEKKNIFVVGDDDQSIYRWRGARIGNILGFEKDFPNCKVVKLEENYRSTKNILKSAYEVVKNIHGRKEKELWTKSGDGSLVTIFTGETEIDEVEFVVGEIIRRVKDGGANYGEFAVFYRTNAQSRVFEESLNRNRVPYRMYGGLKFYSRKEIKDALSYFRLGVNEMDEVAFLRAISSPPRGIGPAALSKLKGYCVEKNVSLLAACGAEDNGIAGTAGKKLLDFFEIIKKIKMNAPVKPAGELIEMVLEGSRFIDYLLDKRTAQDNARVENLKELVSAPHKEELLTEFIERVALQAEADLVEDSGENVSLMTLHVSKGLEFNSVFMVGMEENLFPHFNSMDSIEELEEERRLCYVGMTRARNRLYMTNASTRKMYGQFSMNEPSPFLTDIPEEIIERKRSPKKQFAGSSSQSSGYRSSYSSGQGFKKREQRSASGFGASVGVFSPGKEVKHRIFGKGVIKKCEGAGDETKLTILFRHAGMKKLKSRFVELVA